jgi:aminopeptidase N
VPSYTVAWAVGKYTCQDLGVTEAGTSAQVCWLPRGKTKALEGTKDLVAVFDWLERTIGAYTFGDRVASVSVAWPDGAAGGIEHHPFWHIFDEEMADPLVHAHEATHGWYGTGVRIRCWEDFVLSEGTTSYLSARALGVVGGKEVEEKIWADYRQLLIDTLAEEDILAWPDSCNEVDILNDGLFSDIVYMKGAFFYRAVAEAIGAEQLDRVLAAFYRDHVNRAAGMADMLEYIRVEGGFDPDPLAKLWLRSKGNPFE